MENLQAESNVLQLALSTANAGTFIYQATREHLSWDDRCREIFGLSEYSFDGHWQQWAQTFENSPYAKVQEAIAEQIDGEATIDVNYELQCADGVNRVVRTIANVIRDHNDEVLVVSGIHVDMTEQAEMANSLKAAKQHARQNSTTDSLTKTLNKATLLRDCTTIFNISERYKRDFSVVWLELDNAEGIENEHGQMARRNALVQVAQQVRGKIRDVDLLGRFAANQFLLVLPETTPQNAETVACSIRTHINNLSISTQSGQQKLSCSFGVSGVGSGQEADLKAVLRDANSQLKDAISKGGNRIAIADYDREELVNSDATLAASNAAPNLSDDVTSSIQHHTAANHDHPRAIPVSG